MTTIEVFLSHFSEPVQEMALKLRTLMAAWAEDQKPS